MPEVVSGQQSRINRLIIYFREEKQPEFNIISGWMG